MEETQGTWVWSLGSEDPPEKEMTTLFCILASEILWTEEPDGLQSKKSQTVKHDWAHTHNTQDQGYVCFI